MLVRWTQNPLPQLGHFSQQFDEVFRGLLGDVNRKPPLAKRALAVTETDEGYVVHGLLPGVLPGDLELSATSDTLTLGAKRLVEAPEGFSAIKRERKPLEFERTFRFATRIDVDSAKAELKDGVLTLHVSKAADAKPRKITITG